MSKTSSKRYVVRAGKKTGIFDNRNDCKAAVSGFKDAKYKSFTTKEDATIAYSQQYKNFKGKKTISKTYSTAEKKKIGLPVMSSISVDAACSGNPGILEFRGVITKSKKEIFSFGPYPNGTVNIGEFLALIEGIKYCLKSSGACLPIGGACLPIGMVESKDLNGRKKFIIYSDSRTAIARVRNMKVNTTLNPTLANSNLFVMLDEATQRLKSNFKITDFDKKYITIEHVRGSSKTPNTNIEIRKRITDLRGEIPADYDRK